jgi:hypothetical protein
MNFHRNHNLFPVKSYYSPLYPHINPLEISIFPTEFLHFSQRREGNIQPLASCDDSGCQSTLALGRYQSWEPGWFFPFSHCGNWVKLGDLSAKDEDLTKEKLGDVTIGERW